jgi:hypothetical protein
MPPAQTQISCPNCRRPVRAVVEQLFDLYEDPSSKERLLTGAVNYIQCPNCGFQGELATPIVYHDPGKELLLTYTPASLALDQANQERAIGSLIKQVMNRLPQEMRKGYLFSPQTVLTHDGLVERILQADGITREMIQAQQEKIRLLQHLVNSPTEARESIIAEEDPALDRDFFALLTRLLQTSAAAGDEESVERLTELQTDLLNYSTFGQEMQGQLEEIQAAAETLQAAGEGLTREKLVDLVVQAPNLARVSSYVSLARDGMDYEFFQILTSRIDAAEGDERARLTQLRTDLLELTSQVDRQIEARMARARDLLSSILQSHSIQDAVVQNLDSIDQFFIDVLNHDAQIARDRGELEKLEKYGQIMAVLESLSRNPDLDFVEALLDAPDDRAREALMDQRADSVTPEFVQILTGVLAQAEAGGNEELVVELRKIHRLALRRSMRSSLKEP